VRKEEIVKLANFYKNGLLNDTIPFWMKRSIDKKNGGFLTYLDRDGTVLCYDKPMWVQARATWLFAKLYNTVEKRKDWLETARHGFDFIMKNGFDADGRMFFSVTRDGNPIRKRRYLFTETFGIIACAEYGIAAGNEKAIKRAKDTYRLVIDLHNTPDGLQPKYFSETRVTKSHATAMILLATSQILRQVDNDTIYKQIIDKSISEIFDHFFCPDKKVLLETVGLNGERLDSPEGRCINPGHAIETSWFIMEEGRYRNDRNLIDKALLILEGSLKIGWDKKFGGIFYFVDIKGKPPEQLEWDMKLWWPHTEALYALLLAHFLTGKQKYINLYKKVHQWAFAHFPDKEYGEWFGYLHRNGTLSTPVKGNMWKGPFHLPRAQLLCWKLLEKWSQKEIK